MTTVVVFLNCACHERQFSQTCQKTSARRSDMDVMMFRNVVDRHDVFKQRRRRTLKRCPARARLSAPICTQPGPHVARRRRIVTPCVSVSMPGNPLVCRKDACLLLVCGADRSPCCRRAESCPVVAPH